MDPDVLRWLVREMRRRRYRFDDLEWEFVPDDLPGTPKRITLTMQEAWEVATGFVDERAEPHGV